MIVRGQVKGLKPEIVLVFPEVDKAFKSLGYECVLTSGVRETGPKSLHPYGYAADFDATIDVAPPHWERLQIAIQRVLGDQYDVIAHGPKWHIHVEFDPRG